MYPFNGSPLESEIHPSHKSGDLYKGYFVFEEGIPLEKESIRKKLRDMEAEAKRLNDARRQQTRPHSHDYDRGR